MGGLLHQWLLLNSMLRQLNSPNCCSPVNTQSDWRENAICCKNFSSVDYCTPDGHVTGRGGTLTTAVPVRHRSAEKQERKYEDITSRPPAVAVSAGSFSVRLRAVAGWGRRQKGAERAMGRCRDGERGHPRRRHRRRQRREDRLCERLRLRRSGKQGTVHGPDRFADRLDFKNLHGHGSDATGRTGED